MAMAATEEDQEEVNSSNRIIQRSRSELCTRFEKEEEETDEIPLSILCRVCG